MESVAVSLYLRLQFISVSVLLRETWLSAVTAQHLFLSDIRQTDVLPFRSRSAAWCPPPASIKIGLTSVLSPLTYMATGNGAKLASEQPLGPPWILTSLILPFCSLFLPTHHGYDLRIPHILVAKLDIMCWTWWHIRLGNIKADMNTYCKSNVNEEQK